MKQSRSWPFILILALPLFALACGSDGDGGGASPTATSTSVPSPTAGQPSATPAVTETASAPTATASPSPEPTTTQIASLGVSGLAVLRQDVAAGTDDALGAPPAAWGSEADEQAFDRALSFAEWTLSGPVALAGSTDADGRFHIPDLPAGSYELLFVKTLGGDLIEVLIPFTVGTDGQTEIVIEIAPDLIRWSTEFPDGDVIVREIVGPNGTTVVSRDGTPVEVENPDGSFVDPDGDGLFEPDHCSGEIWLCGDDAECGFDRCDAAGQCETERKCTCTASCPDCEDCGPPVCAPADSGPAYRCNDDGSCANPGDRCACVSSCPFCDDCAMQVCVPSCEPVPMVALDVSGPSRLTIGHRSSLRAVARLADGGRIDVTYQVEWQSSDENILTVDSWGTIIGMATGTASASATIGLMAGTSPAGETELASEPFPVIVEERARLARIVVQNESCFPFFAPEGGPFPGGLPEPFPGDFLPPSCHQVVRLGGVIQFSAYGEFADGTFENITRQVEWEVGTPSVGEVTDGLFLAKQAGETTLFAAQGGVVSEPTEIRVVTERTVVDVTIYPLYRPGIPIEQLFDEPFAAGPDFCFDCAFALTLLSGDELPFRASAVFDTGEWEDVTERVAWQSSNHAVATIDESGLMIAAGAGDTDITATLDDVTSAPAAIRVVDEATLLDLSIYQQGADRVVPRGGEAIFGASGYYDIGFGRDLTSEVTWRSSDEGVGDFDEPGIFIGRSAGNVEVWAELDGRESNRLPMEVFETSDIEYCDPDNINRGTWSDGFNRVVLESDCGQYTPPDVVEVRFTVTERERPGGIFDPCLDLFVFQGSLPIRTIREEGCGEPFRPPSAPESDGALPRYQTSAFWDMKDNAGNLVAPGVYQIHGRFFLYYDPVVTIDVAVVAPDGLIPCKENACGNGCGYVHACGDVDPPKVCPTVCTELCDCPLGWGITATGGCEPCTDECCPDGSSCREGIPPCNPARDCCPAGEDCMGELPPCEPPQRCCPLGEVCADPLPPCPFEERCCVEGQTCPEGLPPCVLF